MRQVQNLRRLKAHATAEVLVKTFFRKGLRAGLKLDKFGVLSRRKTQRANKPGRLGSPARSLGASISDLRAMASSRKRYTHSLEKFHEIKLGPAKPHICTDRCTCPELQGGPEPSQACPNLQSMCKENRQCLILLIPQSYH